MTMCAIVSPVPQASGRSLDYSDAVRLIARLHNEEFAERAVTETKLYTETLPYPSLSLSVPLHERLAEIDRVRDENLARIERQKNENIAAIDRNYALVDEALSVGWPDPVFWGWVVGLAAAAGIVHLLRMFS